MCCLALTSRILGHNVLFSGAMSHLLSLDQGSFVLIFNAQDYLAWVVICAREYFYKDLIDDVSRSQESLLLFVFENIVIRV